MNTPGKILQGARERQGFSSPIALAKSQLNLSDFSSRDLAGIERDELNDYLSRRPDEVKRLIDLYQLTPSEARECIAAWSQADRAKVAEWDALALLSPQQINEIIEELEPGDKVGPFTFQSIWVRGRGLSPCVCVRESVSAFSFDTIAALIQLCGITKNVQEGG